MPILGHFAFSNLVAELHVESGAGCVPGLVEDNDVGSLELEPPFTQEPPFTRNFFQDQSKREQDRSNQEQDRSKREQERSKREQDPSNQEQDRSKREQERSKREQDRSNQEQDRSKREQDRSNQDQDRSNREQDRSNQERAAKNARERTEKLHVDPFSLEQTPLKIFAKRYNLPVRCGFDDALRVFPDDPREMPPISCLLEGCEDQRFTNLTDFYEHCDAVHEGYQTYRLRVLHLPSRKVVQFPGSLQRAALQNFAEFQVQVAAGPRFDQRSEMGPSQVCCLCCMCGKAMV